MVRKQKTEYVGEVMTGFTLKDLCQPIILLDLIPINDPRSKVLVFCNRIEISFVEEVAPRVFHLNVKELYEKIECRCKVVCFDHPYRSGKRKLMFDLEKLKLSPMHTVRITILNSENDNFRVEVSRSELLAALAFFFK